jgi:hypothetical protein
MFSSSFTRDFSSPTSCSRLASASFVRCASPCAAAPVPLPDEEPGRSDVLWPPLPEAGGTSARLSLDLVAVDFVLVGAGLDFGSPVVATSVGFETGALPLFHASF